MSNYISREAAINAMCRLCSDTTRDKCTISDICNYVCRLEAVPAADVREVVLCKDCKHYPTNDGYGTALDFPDSHCPANCSDPYYSYKPSPEWFCGNGERKEC